MAGGKQKGKAGAIARQGSVFFEEVMAFLLLAVAFFGLVWQGMLFERDNVVAVIVLSVLAFIVLLKARLAGEWEIRRPYVACVFLLLTAASALSLANAVYMHNALYVVSKNCSFLLLALAVQALGDKLPFGRWLARALAIAGLAAAVLGLDAIWGGYLVGAVNTFLHGGPLADGEQGFLFNMILGDRLSSVFQYPNTAASFLLAAWFASVHGLLHEGLLPDRGGASARVDPGTIVAAGGANIVFMAFVLTLSRGMYLVSVPMLLLCVFFLPRSRKGQAAGLFFLCFVPGFVAGALSLPGAPLRAIHPVLGWLLMPVLFALSGFATGVLQIRQQRRSGAKIGGTAVTGATGATGAAGEAVVAAKAGEVASSTMPDKALRMPGLRRIRQKPALIGLAAFAALAVCVVLALLLAWSSSRPFIPGGGSSLVRQLQADGTGDFYVTLTFDRPIDENLAEMRLSLSGQNRQEMLRGDWKQYIETDLSAFVGQSQISLPFTLADNGTYLMLGLYGVRGDPGGNAITSVSLVSAGRGTKAVRLNKYLFSESLIRRIEVALHPKTMYDRFGFYLDGFRIFRDFPLTGIGGDSWRFIYSSYQLFPYIANDLHSYATQLLVEYGVFGAVLFLGFAAILIALFVRCVRRRQEGDIFLLLVAGTLFAHSMIDVDLTFYGQYVVFTLAFALIRFPQRVQANDGAGEPTIGEVKEGAKGQSAKAGQPAIAAQSAKKRQLSKTGQVADKGQSAKAGQSGQATQSNQPRQSDIGAPVVLRCLRDIAVVALLGLACVIPYRMGRANAYTDAYMTSMSEGNQEMAEALIARAYALDPTKPEYQTALALQIVGRQVIYEYEFTYAQNLVAEARRKGNFSADTLQMLADYHRFIGQYDEAWEAGRRLTDLDPYGNAYWLARGRLVSDILLRLRQEEQEAAQDEDAPEQSAEPETGLSADTTQDPKDAIRDWLEKGLLIEDDMARMSAERWAPIEPDETLAALFAAWREELQNMP